MAPVSRAIHHPADLDAIRREGEHLARSLDGDREYVGRIALLVRELGTNLLRHAQFGVLTVAVEPGEDHGGAIRITSEDQGPGIPDIARALTPGFSTVGGMGEGLPLVKRLADTFTIESSPAGTRIEVVKWVVASKFG